MKINRLIEAIGIESDKENYEYCKSRGFNIILSDFNKISNLGELIEDEGTLILFNNSLIYNKNIFDFMHKINAQKSHNIDIAIHDLHAKKLSLPLWKLLGGTSDKVATYGSGISPATADKTAEAALSAGHNALKLKIGLDTALDIQNISSLRRLLGKDGKLMVDANQAWTAERAKAIIHKIELFDLEWLEEPILADRPDDEWYSLADITDIPLAAGENIFGEDSFSHLVSETYLGIIQPDLAKWGGFTKTVPLAKKIIASKKQYSPHFLGGGIGLLASAHALAAVGGVGLLEVDCNPNPLRTAITEKFFDTSLNLMELGDQPGLGIEPDWDSISAYQVL